MTGESKKLIAKNKRAYFDYILMDRIEVGIELTGTEVKSIRLGKVSLSDSYVTIEYHPITKRAEAFLNNMNIAKYSYGTYSNHEELRKRKLLLKRKEIEEMENGLSVKGLAVVPTSIYFLHSWIKLELAYGKGKKLHDKREAIEEKESKKRIRSGNYE